MKLYKIRNWSEWFENNRSKTVKDLAWVAIPNRHDGEHFSAIMLHERGSEIFSAWILLVQVASRCQPRGTLLRDGGKPHTATSLSIKTRAPVAWFETALNFLENETDWLEIEELADDCQETVRRLSADCQSGAQEGKEGKGTEGKEKSPPAVVVLMEFPERLRSARVMNKWQVWMNVRRGMKKPKDWSVLFNEQIEWLSSYQEDQVFEILSASIRNGWQGLFPPKDRDDRVGQSTTRKLTDKELLDEAMR